EFFALTVPINACGSGKNEQLVLLKGPAQGTAELMALKIRQRRSIGSRGCQPFGSEVLKGAAVPVVGAGLGDNVDHASGRPAEFSVGAAVDDVESLYGFGGQV